LFWSAFASTKDPIHGVALKVLLLTGQRPGEVIHMRREHIVDGWWQMPGKAVPALKWPGTKNGEPHRVWLPAAVQAMLKDLDPEAKTGFVFPGVRGATISKVNETMQAICASLGITEKVTPHDLRRTHGTTIASLGFGSEAMNRIQNHKDRGTGSVYNRHQYATENKRIMEAVAVRILALANGETFEDNVVQLVRASA
jgi:integrase